MDSYCKRLFESAKRVLPSSLPLFRCWNRSFETPCLSFGLIAVFLLVLISVSSGPIIRSLAGQGDFYLSDISKMIWSEEGKDDLFVGPAKNFSPESPQFILVGNSVIKASSPPTTFSSQVLGALVVGYEPEDSKTTITEYFVEEGDTLSFLSSKFGISLPTILWANNLTEKSTIKPGDKLIILPVSGVIHHIKSGDTVSEIAQTYKGKAGEIVEFNQLSNENDIYIGDIIIVPGGVMPSPVVQQQQISSQAPLASSYFIAPVSSPYMVTQGLHWYNAIDFSHAGNACGKPVFAAAGGTVQRTGYDRVAGSYIRILHPNGVVTFYGHLSSILVSVGQPVSQGARIGLIGNTGYTIGRTGCHLHFEVRGARNPFAR